VSSNSAGGEPARRAQVFTLFKTSRTHMSLACRLVSPAPSHVVGPDGVVAVRSQQDLLAGKDGKEVTGARPQDEAGYVVMLGLGRGLRAGALAAGPAGRQGRQGGHWCCARPGWAADSRDPGAWVLAGGRCSGHVARVRRP
jgi:hypothetical protein